ncbi:MAG: hypothetical protein JXR63_02360 [Spirochaetales bacterium]|nr:hypothetical protein [Spirochaetales bacterium]
MAQIKKTTGFNELKETPKLGKLSRSSTCCASGTADCEPDDSLSYTIEATDTSKKLDSFLKLQKNFVRAA